MPNWCNNTLTLTHEDPTQIDRAIAAFQEGKLCQEFHPMQPHLLEDESWYNWRVDNWGTKWDVGGETEGRIDRINENSVSISFESAWCPPIEFYQHIEENCGFAVNATWFEPGMGFAGEFYDGESQHYEWSDLEEARSVIPEHLEEEYGIIADMESWEEENE